jgi:hypothetical protein
MFKTLTRCPNMRSIVALCALLVVAATLVSATNQKGLDFLAANKGKPGVVTLPSGLQYKGAHTFDSTRRSIRFSSFNLSRRIIQHSICFSNTHARLFAARAQCSSLEAASTTRPRTRRATATMPAR